MEESLVRLYRMPAKRFVFRKPRGPACATLRIRPGLHAVDDGARTCLTAIRLSFPKGATPLGSRYRFPGLIEHVNTEETGCSVIEQHGVWFSSARLACKAMGRRGVAEMGTPAGPVFRGS